VTATRVLVVDVADAGPKLQRLIEADKELRVVARITSADDVLPVLRREAPHIVVVQVRGDDDLHIVEQIMGFHPLPILALSGPGDAQPELAMRATVAGAADVLPCPDETDEPALRTLRRQLRMLRGVHVVRHQRARLGPKRGRRATSVPIVGIAASTGGPPAVATVLGSLRGVPAAFLVVQHLHRDFVEGFANWLAAETQMPVSTATAGHQPVPGEVLIGPGDVHLTIDNTGGVALPEQPIGLHRPSADELFRSLAAHVADRAVGVVLTGMGSDGAEGLLAMRRRGAVTIAQDETTSAVFGMPAAAVERDAVSTVAPIDRIAGHVATAVGRMRRE